MGANYDETERRRAQRRHIALRLHDCSDAELDAVDRVLVCIEKRRDILELLSQRALDALSPDARRFCATATPAELERAAPVLRLVPRSDD